MKVTVSLASSPTNNMEYCLSLGDALECLCIENLYFFLLFPFEYFWMRDKYFLFRCSSFKNVCTVFIAFYRGSFLRVVNTPWTATDSPETAAEERLFSFLHWQAIPVEVKGVTVDPDDPFISRKLRHIVVLVFQPILRLVCLLSALFLQV